MSYADAARRSNPASKPYSRNVSAILDVTSGDKDFWVITSTQNITYVKPAKEGAATNLNLVTASGEVYSFLLTEKNGTSMPDLKVYVNSDSNAPKGKPKYYSARR